MKISLNSFAIFIYDFEYIFEETTTRKKLLGKMENDDLDGCFKISYDESEAFTEVDKDLKKFESEYQNISLSEVEYKLLPNSKARAEKNKRKKVGGRSSKVTDKNETSAKSKSTEKTTTQDVATNNLCTNDVDPNLLIISDDDSDIVEVKANSSKILNLVDDNPELSVKVQWNFGKTQVFRLRKHQKFYNLMKEIALKENIDVNDVYLRTSDNRKIRPDDTPYLINYKIYHILVGLPVKEINSVSNKTAKNSDIVQIKIQTNILKKSFNIKFRKSEKFQVLLVMCAAELKAMDISYDKINLSFDGEPLDLQKTPVDMEISNGEIVDCFIQRSNTRV